MGGGGCSCQAPGNLGWDSGVHHGEQLELRLEGLQQGSVPRCFAGCSPPAWLGMPLLSTLCDAECFSGMHLPTRPPTHLRMPTMA